MENAYFNTYKNQVQRTIFLIVRGIRNKFFETPSLGLVEQNLIHVRRIAKEHKEEEYLNKLLKEEFK